MSDSQRIYVVTAGSYSDYKILCPFAGEGAKEGAKEYARLYNLRNRYSEAGVEEYPARAAGHTPPLWHRFTTDIDKRDGDVLSERTESDTADEGEISKLAHKISHNYREPSGVPVWRVMTQGDSREMDRVRKVHSDAVAQKRAEVMGL